MTDEPKKPGETDTAWSARMDRLKRAVTLETLEGLGFDTEDINALQKDQLFLRKLRVASETTNAKVYAGVIGLVFTVLGAFITLAVQHFDLTKVFGGK